MRLKKLFLFVVACCFFSSMQADITATGTLFVKSNASGNGTGGSWGNAVTDFADALAYANEKNIIAPGTVKEIWVAAGTHIPKYGHNGNRNDILAGPGNDKRDKTFAIKRPLKIYGGFKGTETSVAGRTAGNVTTLSGDLVSAGEASGKAYHVVYIDCVVPEGTDSNGEYIVDGFTITGGCADKIGDPNDPPKIIQNPYSVYDPHAESREGGGLFALLQRSENLTVQNNIFIGNAAFYAGGGMFCQVKSSTASLTINNNTFNSNSTVALHDSSIVGGDGYEYLDEAIGGGGGFCIRTSQNKDYIKVFSNEIKNNQAWASAGGVGLYSDSKGKVQFYKNTVTGNESTGVAGGLRSYFVENSEVIIGGSAENANTFTNNKAKTQGGGVYAATAGITTTAPTAKTTISYNLFQENETIDASTSFVTHGGGGLYAYTANHGTATTSVTFLAQNNTYKGNKAPNADGGGATFSSTGKASVTVKNETIHGNTADNYAGVRFYAENGVTANFNVNKIGGAAAGEPNIAAGSFGGAGLLLSGTGTVAYARQNTVIGNKASYGRGGGVRIYVDGSSQLTFGGTSAQANIVTNNTSVLEGGGLHVGLTSGGHASILYNTITNNTTGNNTPASPAGDGGGVYVYVDAGNPTVTIDDNTVSNNTAYKGGGGFFIRNAGTADLKLNRNIIQDNIATKGNGGGINIYSASSSKLYVQNNNKINGNKSTAATDVNGNSGGGGIYITAEVTPEIHILNNEIGKNGKINTSSSFGGGISIASYGGSKIYIKGNTINENTATSKGGGIYSLLGVNSNVFVTANIINKNKALTNGLGGGIFTKAVDAAKMNIGSSSDTDKNTITNNTALKGAGIYSEAQNNANIQITKNTIQTNTANEDGGGIYAEGGGSDTPVQKSTTIISNNTINENTASISGGGIFAIGTTGGSPSITIQANTISTNKSNSTGAGVSVMASPNLTSDIKVLENTITSNSISSIAGGNIIKGAGVWAIAETGSVTVDGNTIESNKLSSTNTSAYGAGIYCEKPTRWVSTATININENTIDKNMITIANTADVNALGGGIYAALQTEEDSKILISYNHIRRNTITATKTIKNIQGGGLYTDLFANTDRPEDNPNSKAITPKVRSISVLNNVIAGNTIDGAFTGKGAGAGMYTNTVKGGATARTTNIINNTIVTNIISSPNGKAGGLGIGYTAYSAYTINVYNNIIWNNSRVEGGNQPSNLDIVNTGNGNVINVERNFLSALASISSDVSQTSPTINDIRLTNIVNAAFHPEFVAAATGPAGVLTADYNLKPNSRIADYGKDTFYTEAGGSLTADTDMNLNTSKKRKQGTSIAAGAYEETAAPPLSIWLGKTADWQDPNNWYPAQVPSGVTDVYIPGKQVATDITYTYVYPSLSGTKASNACDRIFFMPGAQLGRPDLLTYNKVHIEMNYGKGSLASQGTITYIELYNNIGHTANVPAGTKGSAYDGDGTSKINSTKRIQFGAGASAVTLDRGRWNMLSAPLQEMATGDFAFGGFPFSYIKKYDGSVGKTSSYIKGKWADFNNEGGLVFKPGQGFGHYYFPYETNTPYGMDNSTGDTQWAAAKTANGLTAAAPRHIDGGTKQFGLALSNGMLHFPFYADAALSDTRREHKYSGGTSSFYVYAQSPLTSSYFLQWYNNEKHNVSRTAKAEKFIMEDNWGTYTYNAGSGFKVGDIVLVGNPYMSALDFDAFYTKNSSKIKKVYHIYQTTNTYKTYGTGGFQTQNTTDKYIAPMQSFLVEVAAAGTLNLVFETATMAKTSTSTVLKSSQAPEIDYLTITASNPHGEVNTWVRQLEDASDLFCKDDFSKIIDNTNNLPEVYTLATTEEDDQRALLVNSIQTNETTVPIGLASSYNGDITLTVSGMNEYNAKVFFVDVDENIEKEITGKENFAYTFKNIFNEESPVLEGRFALRFSPIGTGTEIGEINNADKAIAAYTKGNDLIVHSSENNLIKMVQVYDLDGRIILEKTAIESSFCKLENALYNIGVYVVKVHTEQGNKSLKIIR